MSKIKGITLTYSEDEFEELSQIKKSSELPWSDFVLAAAHKYRDQIPRFVYESP